MQIITFLWLYLVFTIANVKHPGIPVLPAADTVSRVIQLTPEIPVAQLPDEIDESSGLMVWDGLIWTLNDSGGKEEVYGLDPATGNIVRTVRIRNAKNTDWESLAVDSVNLYIGDFGNNWGRRKDLGIWIVPLEQIGSAAVTMVDAGYLAFDYPEQESFAPALYRSRYDCEAMIAGVDTLYLFAKDWMTRKTLLYHLPARPGSCHAELVDSFNVQGLVTGAAWDPQRNILALSGYENFSPLVWVFYDFTGTDFFGGKSVKITYPDSFYRAQTEGIAFYGHDELLISSEETRLDGAVYRFMLKDILTPGEVGVDSGR